MAHSSRDGPSFAASAPVHPVAQLQGPFDESMLESAYDNDDGVYPDPVTRRNTLLESPTYVRVVAGRWKQRPGERFHPLWKLIAQISFGVHLLAEGMARSEDDVMQILQAHVDEIDGFLERTTEDFDLAQEDIQERLRCLKLPLSHPATFDKMLEDRNFRLSIVDGNEKIEHIVDRTSQAMKDSLKDVQKGYESTTCLDSYLQKLARTWTRLSVEHEAVFVAMLGNVEGWRKTFTALHAQGSKLNSSLKKLTDIINEMQARAGEVSRRLLHQAKVQPTQVMGKPTGRSTPTSRFATTPKQLPGMPVRPGLKQATSNDAGNPSAPMRTSSNETLRRQAILGRSQTPSRDSPSPQFVQRSISPQLVEIGSNAQGRIQSIVPSLLGAIPSPDTTKTSHQAQPSIDAQSERYFPPIELPAHVPEETMQNMPISKQNRLSMGLHKVQEKAIARNEKRNSRLGTSALIDLLRAGPPSSTQRPKSPEASRRGSAVRVSSTHDEVTHKEKEISKVSSSPRSVSISETVGSLTKNNIRRPKKGVKHWFDAVDDDAIEDDKYSVVSGEQINSTTITVTSQPLNFDSHPGTPAWAVTTFAQAEKKKELLKQGAFKSHPPELPLGSPPMAQSKGSPNPLGTITSYRKLSLSSSNTGLSTLGEPGPEVVLSERGSISGRQRTLDANRASAYAPEVVTMEDTPPLPSPSRQFVAEMEGSSPQMSSPGNGGIVELEAPRQHFVLPPRPQAQQIPQAEMSPRIHQQHFILPPRPKHKPPSQPTTPYQQHFVLPPRPQPEQKQLTPKIMEPEVNAMPQRGSPNLSDLKTYEKQVRDNKSSERKSSITSGAKESQALPDAGLTQERDPADTSMSVEIDETVRPDEQIQSDKSSDELKANHDDSVANVEQVIEQFANYEEEEDQGERLTSSVYVPTPNIPIPPSPFGDSPLQTDESQRRSTVQEPLYVLPAIAYKAPPISPSLPPDPVISRKPVPQQQARPISQPSERPDAKSDHNLATRSEEAEIKTTAELISTVAEPELLSESTTKIPLPVDVAQADSSETPRKKEATKAEEQQIVRPEVSKFSASGSVSPSAPDTYDPFKPVDPPLKEIHTAQTVRPARTAKLTPIRIITSAKMGESHSRRSDEDTAKHLSNSSTQGSTNEWKAFFTGAPSPVGSTLSIRSIRRESYMEPTHSPDLLSPASASGRHALPQSPIGPVVKEAVWFSMGSKRDSDASTHPKEPVGLGIITENGKLPLGAS